MTYGGLPSEILYWRTVYNVLFGAHVVPVTSLYAQHRPRMNNCVAIMQISVNFCFSSFRTPVFLLRCCIRCRFRALVNASGHRRLLYVIRRIIVVSFRYRTNLFCRQILHRLRHSVHITRISCNDKLLMPIAMSWYVVQNSTVAKIGILFHHCRRFGIILSLIIYKRILERLNHNKCLTRRICSIIFHANNIVFNTLKVCIIMYNKLVSSSVVWNEIVYAIVDNSKVQVTLQ